MTRIGFAISKSNHSQLIWYTQTTYMHTYIYEHFVDRKSSNQSYYERERKTLTPTGSESVFNHLVILPARNKLHQHPGQHHKDSTKLLYGKQFNVVL